MEKKYDELVHGLRQLVEWLGSEYEENSAYVRVRLGEAADAIEELQNSLSSVRIEANNYRKALEALDGVKR